MNPAIFEFAIDFNLLIEILITIVIFSFFIERSLSVIFGSELFLKWYDPCFKEKLRKKRETECLEEPPAEGEPEVETKKKGDEKKVTKPTEIGDKKSGTKEIISVIVSISAVVFWEFDAVTILFKTYNEPQVFGYAITGMIIAGGTKASIKLFQDVLGFKSSAEKARKE